MDAKNEIDLNSNRKCGIVSYIKSPSSFWVRLDEFKNDYIDMLKRIQKDYENSLDEPELNAKNLTLGSLYCVFNQKLYEWHRCEIIRITQSDISIYYIDIGGIDLVSVKSLRILKDCYKTINRFAIHCSLDNLKPMDGTIWKTAAISRFCELTVFKIVTLTFKSKIENIYNVEMYLKTQNICESLISYGLAEHTSQDHKDLLKFIKASTLPLNEYDQHELEVTCIYSPFCFYAQVKKDKDDFLVFENQLQDYYENELKRSEIILLKKPRIGQMCIARYSVDEAWYRAIIKEIDLDLNSVNVFFIDYGNNETVQIDGNLLVINEQFVKYPCMGLLCCLDGIRPIIDANRLDSLSDEVINFMYDAMSIRVVAKFLDKTPNDCYKVEVSVEELVNGKPKLTNLADMLLQANYVHESIKTIPASKSLKRKSLTPSLNEPSARAAKQPSESQPVFKLFPKSELTLEKGEKCDFTITHIETICEFYVKKSGTKEDEEFRQLMADMQYFYEKKLNLPQPVYQVLNACVYNDTDFKKWHRAQINTLIDADHCVIYLIDIGQSKLVNRRHLRDIYEKYLQTPAQVAQAGLFDLMSKAPEELDEFLHNKFKDVALWKTFYGKVVDFVPKTDHLSLKRKHFLNLFDSNSDSLFTALTQDLNNSVLSQSFRPVASKFEESSLSLHNETLNDESQTRTTRPTYYNHRTHEPTIDDDETSPFPKHDHSSALKSADLTDFPRPLSKTSITLIQTADKLKQLENKINHYESICIEPSKSYPITVTNYENALNFSAQITDWFVEFDEHYEEFQESCNHARALSKELLKQIAHLETCAIAARFYDDSLWYRARIINESKDDKLVVEFIDYGNRQETLVADCVFLSEKFTKFKSSAVTCAGLAYITAENSKLNNDLLQDLLFYSTQTDRANKHEWSSAYFVRHKSAYLLEIDELYAEMHKLNLVNLSTLFEPHELDEPVCKQANEEQIRHELVADSLINAVNYDAVVSEINSLQFIYLTLKQSLDELRSLEAQLRAESLQGLIKLEAADLELNRYYLVKHNNCLYRCVLLTPTSGKFIQMQLIDYGSRLTYKSKQELESANIYVLMTKYFKYPTFALHCRLPYGLSIEKVWLADEKQKFYKSIKPHNEYKIKLMSAFAPHIIEFRDGAQKIDFQFNEIVPRINKNELEAQLVLNGSRSMSLTDEFYLGGAWLRPHSAPEFSIFIEEQIADTVQQETLFVYSKHLLAELEFYLKLVERSLQTSQPVSVDTVKKGDILLIKRKTRSFLESLHSVVRPLVESYFSRVRVKSVSTCKTTGNRTLSLFYCDYGFSDYLQIAHSQIIKLPEFEIYPMTLHSRILPSYTLECSLKRSSLVQRLNAAKTQNDFVDAFYLNSTLTKLFDSLGRKSFKIDFTNTLELYASGSSTSQFSVDLITNDTNKSLIDLVIDYGLSDIENYSFLAVITHYNHLSNFFMQKFDDDHLKLLDDLQARIQLKIVKNELKQLDNLELNKLCVAFYAEDEQFYRAKIINIPDRDTEIEVFYVDFGNTSRVQSAQLKEITPDLIDLLPKAFSINCELDLTDSDIRSADLDELNKFFSDYAVNDLKFDVKCVKRKENKYKDTSSYLVKLNESESKKSIFDLFREYKLTLVSETSNVNVRYTNDSVDLSSEDDQALAENLTQTSSRLEDETQLGSTTLASVSKSFIPEHLDPSWVEPCSRSRKQKCDTVDNATAGENSWEETASELKNFDFNNDTTTRRSALDESNAKNTTWEETASYLKNYDYNNITVNTTLNNTAPCKPAEPSWQETPADLKNFNYNLNNTTLNNTDQSLLKIQKSEAANKLDETDLDADEAEKDEDTYSTATDRSSFILNPTNLTQDNDRTLTQSVVDFDLTSNETFSSSSDKLTIKKCMISFLTTTQSFYLQEAGFLERITLIQPEIEDCYDPFDLNLSTLCIGQWENDEQFYRLKVLDWKDDSSPTAYCLFIDYGNTEDINKDTITAMSHNLHTIKPLAIHCKLHHKLDDKPNCFQNLEDLVNAEMVFDAVVESKAKLDQYYHRVINMRSSSEFDPIDVRLYIVDRVDFEINEKTLGQEEWPTVLQYIKSEPLSVLIHDESQDLNASAQNQKNCINYSDKIKSNHKKDDEEDDDEDENNSLPDLSYVSNQSLPSSQLNSQSNSTNKYQNGYHGKQQQMEQQKEQEEIDKFVDENKEERLEINRPEVFMYNPYDCSELASLRHDTTASTNDTTCTIIDQSDLNLTDANDTVDSTFQENRNLSVSHFADQESNWTKSNETTQPSLTLNETAQTNLNFNQSVSRYLDEDSNWTVNQNDETVQPKIINNSLMMSKLDESSAEANKDVSKFADQSSNWDANESSKDYIARTINESDMSNWSDDYKSNKNDETVNQSQVVENIENVNVLEFADQDSNWTINKDNTNANWTINTTVNENLNVSKFADQSSNWTINQEDKTVINETRNNKNQDISQFADQDSNWTVNHDKTLNETVVAGEQNVQINEFRDQDSNWTVNQSHHNLSGFKTLHDDENTKLNETETTYLSKTINENNVSVWQSDINQTIFDSSEKKINRKLNVEDEDDLQEQVKYTRFVDGFVMRVNSLDDFYLQIEDADVQLMEMKAALEKCRKPYEKTPQLGTICVAPCHIDSQYYRAQIVEIEKAANFSVNNPNSSFNTSISKLTESTRVRLHYIDYGNEDFVDLSEIYKISLELKNIAPLALNCRLNLSRKLKDWINKMADLKQDVTDDLKKCFKRLTSKSKIKLKVIKETNIETRNGELNHIRPPALLVDAFLGDENICDSLLVNTMISYQPKTLLPDVKLNETKEKDFDGYLINLKSFDKLTLFEVNVQNQSVLKLIDDLFQNFNNINDCSSHNLEEKNINGPFCFAPLPEHLVESYKLKNPYSRVAILEKLTSLTEPKSTRVQVQFIDFDFKQWMDMDNLIMINSYLSQIQPSVERFYLNVQNGSDMSTLSNLQLEHLNEIFRNLINMNEIQMDESKFNWSAKFKTVILTSNTNVFATASKDTNKITKTNRIRLDSIRLYDTEREMLDVNRILEMCISIMARPFVGHITHNESDFTQFECLSSASAPIYLNELQKIYRSSGYFIDETKSPEKKDYKCGQVCLANEKKEPEIQRTTSTESILSLNGFANLEETQLEPVRKGYFRGILIDVSTEKCVVLNVDNGKRISLAKRRIIIIEEETYARPQLLLRQIPFLFIRARPNIPITDSNLKRILSNSRFYLEPIRLNIIGSWSNSENRTLDTLDSNQFIQSEKDLNKVIELLFESIQTQFQAQPVMDNTSVNKISSISFNKRKRKDDLQSDIAPAKQIDFKDSFYVSYVKSVNLFYIHSSQALRTIEFIEELFLSEQMDRSSKLVKEEPKLDTIYGIYSEKDQKYYRILLKSQLLVVKNNYNQFLNSQDRVYQAFYLDYGFTDEINSKDIIFVSESIQQFAPQAICCKLNGFSTSSSRLPFADADVSDLTNETNCDSSDLEFKQETDFFLKLTNNKPLMATVYQNYCHLKKISNIIPLQSDNYMKPIEIVMHSVSEQDDLESNNLTHLIKKQLSIKKLPSLESSDTSKKTIERFNIRKYLNSDEEMVAEFGYMNNPNQFYLHLTNWTDKLNELSKKLESNSKTKLSEIKPGTYCVYFDSNKSLFKRAQIKESTHKKFNSVNLFLVDTGEHLTSISTDLLYNLNESFYQMEPLCFECTLGLQYSKLAEEKYTNKFRSMIQLSKYLKLKLVEELQPSDNKYVYLINLYGSRATQRETDRSFNLNISEELRTNNPVLLLSVSSPTSKTEIDLDSLRKTDHLRKFSAFKEEELPLNEKLKIQLTSVDTVKHFGIVVNANLEKRYVFIKDFHQWHKDNKKNLTQIFKSETSNENQKPNDLQVENKKQSNKYYIGQPCAVCSVQIGKWCRGLIASIDFNSQMTYIYLVDYCRLVQISMDRIFKIEKKEFLDEPIYTSRCQLVDDEQQRAKFEKYLDLIKGSISPLPKENSSSQQDHLNSSHIAMENIEIQIICLSKQLTQISPMSTLQNDQYTINVVEIKRIKTSFPVSPFTNIANGSKVVSKLRTNASIGGLSPLNVNNLSVENKKYNDDNTLNLKNMIDFNNISTTSIPNHRTGHKGNFLNLESEQSIMNYTNDTSFTNFSAVTESTRITPNDNQNTEDDLTQTNNEQTVMSITEFNHVIKYRATEKHEDTSNWISY